MKQIYFQIKCINDTVSGVSMISSNVQKSTSILMMWSLIEKNVIQKNSKRKHKSFAIYQVL